MIVPPIDLVFTVTADDTVKVDKYKIMKDTVQAIADKYGTRQVRISFVSFGQPPVVVFDFNTAIPDKETLAKELGKVTKVTGNPDLTNAIKKAKDIFDNTPVRPESKKVLVVITHRKFNIPSSDIRTAVEPLDKEGIRIITVGLGDGPNNDELKNITRTERAIIRPPSNDEGKQVADEILKVILNGKSAQYFKQMIIKENLKLSNFLKLLW